MMTPEQFERWKDFATRMARTVYANHRRPTSAWILRHVEALLEELRPERDDIADWDGNDHDDAFVVCDHVTDYIEAETPAFRNLLDERQEIEAVLLEEAYGPDWTPIPIETRDAIRDYAYEVYKDREDKAFRQWARQFFGPVECCLRAGLDLASSPSAGVVGFTAGDIQAMYPEGLPPWLGDIEFGPDEGPTRRLAEVPASQGVWL